MTQIASALVNLPVSVLLARSLGPSDFGQYQFLFRGALIAVSIGCYGYPHALAWAAQRSITERGDAQIWAASLRTGVLGGAGLAALGALVVFVIGYHPGGIGVWLLMAAFPLCNMLSANMVNFHRGKLNIKQIASIRLSQVVVWMALNVSFLVLGRLDLQAAVLSMVLSQAIAAAVGAAFGLSYGRRGIRLHRRVPRSVRIYARHAFLGIAVRDLNVYVDQLVIALFLGPRELGLYAVAVSLTASLGLLSSPITNTVQPIMQSARPEERIRVATTALAATVLVLGLPAMILAAMAALYVPMIYGSQYDGSIMLIQILAVAAVVDGLNSCCHGILLGAGFPLRGSVSAGVGLVSTALFLAVLMPLVGVEGAAIGSVAAYLIVLMFMLRAVTRSLEVANRAFTNEFFRSIPRVLRAGPTFVACRFRRSSSGREESNV